MLRKVLARRIGGKSMGRAWKGRACKEVTSVASRVGGTGDSERIFLSKSMSYDRVP